MSLAYLALACQMRWTGEVSIIITLDWEKRIRVVKLCMTFESGPKCKLTLFWAIYDLVLIQCGFALYTLWLCPEESFVLKCRIGSSDFPRSLCFVWFWFVLEILRLVYKKVFFKILIDFYLIWAFNFQKNSTLIRVEKKFLLNWVCRVSKEAKFCADFKYM